MSYFPAPVTVIGTGSTNPTLSNRNVVGVLSLERTGIVFSSRTDKIVIPFPHIDECYVAKVKLPGKSCLLSLLFFLGLLPLLMLGVVGSISGHMIALGFPIALCVTAYFLLIDTSTAHRIVVKAWNEDYGMDTTTEFEIGTALGLDVKAREMVREINIYRGGERRAAKEERTVTRRAS